MASATVVFCCTVVLLAGVVTSATAGVAPRLRAARSAAASEETDDAEIIRACNETSPISRAALNSVLINKHLLGTETGGFKCFLHCLYTKYNWMDELGGFHLRAMKEVLQTTHLPGHVIDLVLYKCSAVAYPDKCERAYQFTECFWAEAGKYPDTDEHAHAEQDVNYHY